MTEKEISKLTGWMNAEKWRKENGLTTPEWIQFARHQAGITAIYFIAGSLAGFVCGYYHHASV